MNGVEIVEQEDIPLSQMEDGQIGITLNIKNWSNCRVRILPPGTTLRIK